MKNAVSIPDELLQQADRVAQSTGKSRSELVREALTDYLTRNDPDAITQAMNQVLDTVDSPPEEFVATASDRVLRRTEW